jgi:hypothetical protein
VNDKSHSKQFKQWHKPSSYKIGLQVSIGKEHKGLIVQQMKKNEQFMGVDG